MRNLRDLRRKIFLSSTKEIIGGKVGMWPGRLLSGPVRETTGCIVEDLQP